MTRRFGWPLLGVIMAAMMLALAWPASTLAQATLAQAAKPVDALAERAKTEMFTNPEGILRDAEKAAADGEREADPAERVRIVATAEWLQAQAKMRIGDIEGAKSIANKAIQRLGTAPKPSKLLGDLLLTLGNINTIEADVQSALRNMQKAHDVYQAIGHKRGQAMALQGLGNIYHQAGDYETALKYYQQSETTYSSEPSLSFMFHNNHGSALSGLERFAEAEQQYSLALVSARKMGGPEYIATVSYSIAVAQFRQNKFAVAIKSIDEALPLSQSPINRTRLLALKAYIALKSGDLASAEKLIDLAMKDVDANDRISELRDSHQYAYEIYSRLGRHELAAKHLDAVWHMDEENVKVMTSASAALMAARFDFATQKSQIAELKAVQLEQEAAKQRLILIGVTLAALGLIIGLILITRSRNAERSAKLGLEVTNKQLEKAMAAKMEFLATTSHEIRTPLNGILGMTQVMLADQRLDETARERVNVVNSAGETMKALVDDILDVAKMENGNLSVEMGSVELRRLLTETVQIWRIQAEEKGIEFTLDLYRCPDRIKGDGDRIRQVIFNLLSNALKFTAQGKVSLTAEAAEKDDDRLLRISVADSGIGIAPEWHDRIFEMFQQVDGGKARNFGGSGLGLAICHRLVEAMDGLIWVESAEGQGATFLIELPLAEIGLEATADGNAGELQERRAILIVESNPLARGLYRAMLTDHYDEIAFAASLDEAIAYLGSNPVNHVLVDEGLAPLGSPEVNELREKTKAPLTLASNVANDDLSPAFSSRIGKPVTKNELIQAVGR